MYRDHIKIKSDYNLILPNNTFIDLVVFDDGNGICLAILFPSANPKIRLFRVFLHNVWA